MLSFQQGITNDFYKIIELFMVLYGSARLVEPVRGVVFEIHIENWLILVETNGSFFGSIEGLVDYICRCL